MQVFYLPLQDQTQVPLPQILWHHAIFVESIQKFAVFFPLPSWTQLFEGGLVLTQGKILIMILFLC